ncbi:hypothetical protein Taro_052304 [Colocasia esculenta]|uniref:Uncharacterized protein n=1 Tax=Colocasia esculenta TaxID=4460 RepID=A0A843XJB6_COLES|nr:hypothetical protein [Colocasia esculenta]
MMAVANTSSRDDAFYFVYNEDTFDFSFPFVVGQTPLESAGSKDPTRLESGSAGSDSPSRPDSAIHALGWLELLMVGVIHELSAVMTVSSRKSKYGWYATASARSDGLLLLCGGRDANSVVFYVQVYSSSAASC